MELDEVMKNPLRSEKAEWYEGAVKIDVLKEDEFSAYDLVQFEGKAEYDSGVYRSFHIYRIFKIGDRTELSADHEYISPVFSGSRKEAIKEWENMELFIKDVAKRQFRL